MTRSDVVDPGKSSLRTVESKQQSNGSRGRIASYICDQTQEQTQGRVQSRDNTNKKRVRKFVWRGETMEVRKGGKRQDLKQADSTWGRPNKRKQGEQSRALGREECDELCRTAAAIRAAVGGFDSIIEGQSHPRLVCFGRRSSDVSIPPRARLANCRPLGRRRPWNKLKSCVGLVGNHCSPRIHPAPCSPSCEGVTLPDPHSPLLIPRFFPSRSLACSRCIRHLPAGS